MLFIDVDNLQISLHSWSVAVSFLHIHIKYASINFFVKGYKFVVSILVHLQCNRTQKVVHLAYHMHA